MRVSPVRVAYPIEAPTCMLPRIVDSLSFHPNTLPIDCLVQSQSDRRGLSRLACHSCAARLPRGSFLMAGTRFPVCSPALNYVQMASCLSKAQLVHFGMMLCGIYAKDPRSVLPSEGRRQPFREQEDDSEEPSGRIYGRNESFIPCTADRPRELFRRSQLTSIAEIRSFIQETSRVKGLRRAREALPLILEGSASPMESVALLMLCLPWRMGGFAFPRPLVNCRVYIDGSGEVRTREGGGAAEQEESALRAPGAEFNKIDIARRDEQGRGYFECDMVWPQAGAIVEYHGRFSHEGWSNVAHDLRRSNILVSCGFDYRAITKEILDDLDKLREFASGLASCLGVALHPPTRDFVERQRRLRVELGSDPLDTLVRRKSGSA